MTEIPRLKDMGSPELRALLRDARAFEPSTERRDAIVRGVESSGLAALLEGSFEQGEGWSEAAREVLESGGSAGGGSAATAAAASAAKAGFGWKVIALGCAVLGTGGAMWGASSLGLRERPPARVESSRRPLEGPPQAPSETVVATATVREAQREVAKKESTAPSPLGGPIGTEARPTNERSSKSEDSESQLASELVALRAARQALRSGDPTEARRILRELETRAPASSLRLEAEVLMIESLMALGENELARIRARRFVEANPKSLLAERLRSIAGTAVAPPRDAAQASEGTTGDTR